MKKIVIAVSLVFLSLTSCQKKAEKDEVSQDTTSVVMDSVSSTVSEEHNSQTSLDYFGMYRGVLPCADCKGILMTIILDDQFSYKIRSVYMGKSVEAYEKNGRFKWNNEENTIILDDIKNQPNRYFVGENTLTQLDMKGKKITGKLASKYILVKISELNKKRKALEEKER